MSQLFSCAFCLISTCKIHIKKTYELPVYAIFVQHGFCFSGESRTKEIWCCPFLFMRLPDVVYRTPWGDAECISPCAKTLSPNNDRYRAAASTIGPQTTPFLLSFWFRQESIFRRKTKSPPKRQRSQESATFAVRWRLELTLSIRRQKREWGQKQSRQRVVRS